MTFSWWSNEWSLFSFQRAHVISGLRHVWSPTALNVMWIVDIYPFYPSLANSLKHSSLSNGAVLYSCFKVKHTENMCYTAGSNNRSEADLNVFFSLMWRVGLLFKLLCTYFYVVQGVYYSKVIRRIPLKLSMGD